MSRSDHRAALLQEIKESSSWMFHHNGGCVPLSNLATQELEVVRDYGAQQNARILQKRAKLAGGTPYTSLDSVLEKTTQELKTEAAYLQLWLGEQPFCPKFLEKAALGELEVIVDTLHRQIEGTEPAWRKLPTAFVLYHRGRWLHRVARGKNPQLWTAFKQEACALSRGSAESHRDRFPGSAIHPL